ncbi:SPW repeat protein [Amycolatopsis sp. NPDC059027]|uniref:SPW repeat protein n=1 Tax=unclassified Amycolatopsis TaxID=2618356 RepID=UPI0036712E1D
MASGSNPVTHPERMGTARGAVGAGAGLVVLAGLYLIVAPWITRFGGAADLAVSNTVTGLALVGLAAGRTLDERLRPLWWVAPVLGAWAVASPGVLRFNAETPPSAGAWVGNAVAGVVAAVAALAIFPRRTRE